MLQSPSLLIVRIVSNRIVRTFPDFSYQRKKSIFLPSIISVSNIIKLFSLKINKFHRAFGFVIKFSRLKQLFRFSPVPRIVLAGQRKFVLCRFPGLFRPYGVKRCARGQRRRFRRGVFARRRVFARRPAAERIAGSGGVGYAAHRRRIFRIARNNRYQRKIYLPKACRNTLRGDRKNSRI